MHPVVGSAVFLPHEVKGPCGRKSEECREQQHKYERAQKQERDEVA